MQKPDENPDHRFLQLAAQGDKRAFGMLYERYLNEIYRYVYFKVGNKRTAEDITEEAFVKTWGSLSRIYQSDGKIDNLRAWLYRTANNLVTDFYRKKQPEDIINPPQPNSLHSLEEIAIEKEEAHQILQGLQKLKPDFQQVIILRLINDLSHKEIAKIMQISEAHSRVLFYRAVKKLRNFIGSKEGSYA